MHTLPPRPEWIETEDRQAGPTLGREPPKWTEAGLGHIWTRQLAQSLGSTFPEH